MKTPFLLILSASILFSIGLLMVFNTTSAEILDKSLASNTHHPFFKQIFYAVIGLFLGCIVYYLGYEALMQKSGGIFGICVFLLILVFIPKVGVIINGARRWIYLFGVSFQPSEFAKYVIPMYFIYKVTKEKKKIDFRFFLMLISILTVPTFLILIEPDNGTTALILLSLVILFILCRIRSIYWTIPICIIGAIGIVAAFHMPHVPDRLRVYLNPESDILGKGHQPHQAKIAAGSGRLWGKGFGESLQKFNYLPEARSDYIAAIYAEEFGFIGVSVLIILYMLLAYSGFRIASSCSDIRGFYFASIITFLITFQAFLNLGVVSNLLPSKGTTLPFFSQGGSSLITNIIAVFLLVNISKKQEVSFD